MIRTSNPIFFYNDLKILQVKDERLILVQIDMLPVNLKLGEEFYIQTDTSLILCQVRKLYNYSYQQTQHMFKGEYCYVEIEIKSVRSFEKMMESESIHSDPVQVAYHKVLERYKNEINELKDLSKRESPEKIASRIHSIASKYKNQLRSEITNEVNKYNSKSEMKLIGAELQKRIQFAVKNYDDVVRDSIQSFMKKPDEKKFLTLKEVI